METSRYFSPHMRLADLIAASPAVVLMLPRFGIKLGFGEATVAHICKASGVSEDFFLMVCNVYSFDHYMPSAEEIARVDMTQLVPYLLASHKYYQQSQLPHIESHLKHLAARAGRYGEALIRFYEDYKNDMNQHFKYEEDRVFPYLKQLQTGSAAAKRNYKISEYARSHGNTEEKLNDLIQIIFKYLPGDAVDDEMIEMVFDILHFSVDLNKHSLIEEKILIPYVESLERKQRL